MTKEIIKDFLKKNNLTIDDYRSYLAWFDLGVMNDSTECENIQSLVNGEFDYLLSVDLERLLDGSWVNSIEDEEEIQEHLQNFKNFVEQMYGVDDENDEMTFEKALDWLDEHNEKISYYDLAEDYYEDGRLKQSGFDLAKEVCDAEGIDGEMKEVILALAGHVKSFDSEMHHFNEIPVSMRYFKMDCFDEAIIFADFDLDKYVKWDI